MDDSETWLVLPPSRQRRDTSLREGGCLPPMGEVPPEAVEGVLTERLRREDKIPAGTAQRNFPVPRGHAPHPLPPPAQMAFGVRELRWRGRGRIFYTSHFKGGFHPPLKPPGRAVKGGKVNKEGRNPLRHNCIVPAPRLPARVLVPSGHRPGPTGAATETGDGRSPPATIALLGPLRSKPRLSEPLRGVRGGRSPAS